MACNKLTIKTIKEKAKYWDYERTDSESRVSFQFMVYLYLTLDPARGVQEFYPLSDKMAEHFEAFRTWPEKVAFGEVNPHPLLKRQVVKYILSKINEAETVS